MNETPNKAAQSLGRLGKGKSKTISPAERERRRSHMRMIQSKRWPSVHAAEPGISMMTLDDVTKLSDEPRKEA